MSQAVEFALKPGDDGKRPTRDQVSAFIRQLRKQGDSRPSGKRPRAVTLRMNGRTVTVTVDAERDSASGVAEDLKAIVGKLRQHADVPPDGWPFLFQQ